jgi:hypothetical protein
MDPAVLVLLIRAVIIILELAIVLLDRGWWPM